MHFPPVSVQLPDWVEPFLNRRGEVFPSAEDRMALVVELARQNDQIVWGGMGHGLSALVSFAAGATLSSCPGNPLHSC